MTMVSVSVNSQKAHKVRLPPKRGLVKVRICRCFVQMTRRIISKAMALGRKRRKGQKLMAEEGRPSQPRTIVVATSLMNTGTKHGMGQRKGPSMDDINMKLVLHHSGYFIDSDGGPRSYFGSYFPGGQQQQPSQRRAVSTSGQQQQPPQRRLTTRSTNGMQ
ncbi:hypothetical protein LOK49_LG10G01838 [Camellia lanceoleosa]|uniref:Uncharacterized protein n=1 Tax=Camellia lanceoleosa TaxID=1840588 RepID=A0ACC0G7U9_9ERIC|nr:hypothetical protein LOK49_LG10G01838 [Camellia lanceoleosa]